MSATLLVGTFVTVFFTVKFMVAIDPLSHSPFAQFSSRISFYKTLIKMILPASNILLMKVQIF